MKEKSTTVRVNHETRLALDELSASEGRTFTSIVAEAVELYRRKLFLDSLNDSFRRLKEDELSWKDVREEAAGLEGTLMDGLEEE